MLWNASAIFYAITYLVMFAIPLVGLRGRGTPAPLWLKGSVLSGLLITLLFVTLSIVPIVQVESRLLRRQDLDAHRRDECRRSGDFPRETTGSIGCPSGWRVSFIHTPHP